jgi:hypothetical protein
VCSSLTAPTYYGRKIKIIGLGHQSVAAFNSYQVSLEREGMTVLGISNEMHNAGHRGNHKCVVIKVKIYQ